jgi:diguanylate cyclase (GGDEF)-like protein/PAS domain S-box-containing protein
MKKVYKDWTKEELIKEIKTLKSHLKVEESRFLVEFPWAGNLGQWFWNYERNDVRFNDKKVKQLGYDPKKIGKIGFEFFTEKLHPEDYDRVMDNMQAHLKGQTDAYEVEYRIQHKNGHYLWYYDRGTVTKRKEDGSPVMIQGIVFDVTESKRVEAQLIELSEKDELTRFYNRRMLFKRLNQLVSEYKRSGRVFALIMYDIDHFKDINDQYGHMVGDQVLEELSALVLKEKRDSDQAFRYGGEEFVLLLPETSKEAALKFAKRLHKKIQSLQVQEVKQITVSIGLVSYHGKESVDEVMKRADALMYEAKHAGRNQIKYKES